jgi:hypothetical protein
MQSRQSWRFHINAPDVINEVIEGEAIILHLGTGRYYSARGCGAEVWAWLSGGVAAGDVEAALAASYDASPDAVAVAVDDFIDYLLREALVVEVPADEVASVGVAIPQARSEGSKPPFEAPAMESFSDLEDLLLLDPVHEVSTELGWPHVAASSDGS